MLVARAHCAQQESPAEPCPGEPRTATDSHGCVVTNPSSFPKRICLCCMSDEEDDWETAADKAGEVSEKVDIVAGA